MMRSWFTIAAVLLLATSALAQLEPAGNQHPEAQVAVDDHGHSAPFGEPRLLSQTPEQKAAFAAAIDLSPLRATAVFHNGRVKILDTLAREMLRTITGRERFEDLVLADGATLSSEAERYAAADPERFDKEKFDALFVLLDLSIDPAHYADRPLIAIDYLPVREYYLEAAFQGDQDRQDLWLRMTRVSPIMVETLSQPIFDRYGHLEPVRRSIGRVDNALRVAAGAGATLRVVAPETNAQQWVHVEDLPDGHPARAAAVELGRAWRALDADAANASIATFAQQLAAINPETHPAGRARVELMYNNGRFFDLGMWAYGLSFLALILAFGTGRKWLIGLGVGLLAGALMLHASGFVLRCVISERFAIQNQFESMVGLSLFAAVVATGLMLLKRQWLFGAAAAGVGFLVLIAATQTAMPGQTIGREAAILNTSVLLKYHVTTVLVSYGLITVGFLCSVFYLLVSLMSKRQGAREAASVALRDPSETGQPRTLARTLDDLDKAQMTVLQLAFWTLGVGILLGAWWADHSWGRWWAWDPKETWALITWIVYLIVIHVRLIMGRGKALLTAWLSVAGFVIMLWTYFGVNLLLAGLHAYA
ncbi:MAG: cytochrome c biogenesis protein CcsA [Phycisphaera sp.]|nr:MAG: cytochrome c biogenesis protein CcsA [Phycisphaera sp.]